MCWSCGRRTPCLNQAWARSFLQYIVTQNKCLFCLLCFLLMEQHCVEWPWSTQSHLILYYRVTNATHADNEAHCETTLLSFLDLLSSTFRSLGLIINCWPYIKLSLHITHAADIAYCDTEDVVPLNVIVRPWKHHTKQAIRYFSAHAEKYPFACDWVAQGPTCAESSGHHQGKPVGVLWQWLY